MNIYQSAQRYPVYSTQAIQQAEQQWFAQGNSSLALMQQASLMMAYAIRDELQKQGLLESQVLVWCGVGNNAGDGYFVAQYLTVLGIKVAVYAPQLPKTAAAQYARHLVSENVVIYSCLDDIPVQATVHIDAIFGIGLSRGLDPFYQALIQDFNQQQGFKFAIDIPSGLNAYGLPMPIAVYADVTLCLIALKCAVVLAQAKSFVGELYLIPLIPLQDMLPSAVMDTQVPTSMQRLSHAHKGHFGHTLVIAGHHLMLGASILASEASFAVGVGKVTLCCHQQYHAMVLARSPNIMLKDSESLTECLNDLTAFNSVAFGMGLGRDEQAEQTYLNVMSALLKSPHLQVVLDADALWFLAKHPQKLPEHWVATPHSAEAGRLLHIHYDQVEQNRIHAIEQLQQRYGASWVLKGAGSLTLEQGRLQVCAFGNPAMATAGMGDVLAGVIAGFKAQSEKISLADCVAWHALAGDELAKTQRTIQAQQMLGALQRMM